MIIISGTSGTGKTTLANRWSKDLLDLNTSVLNVGDVVWDETVGAGLNPISRSDSGRLFLEHFGEDALGKKLMDRLSGHGLVIIDGLRLLPTLDFLKDECSLIAHIHLDAAVELRRKRLTVRDGHFSDTRLYDKHLAGLRSKCNLFLYSNDENDYSFGSSQLRHDLGILST